MDVIYEFQLAELNKQMKSDELDDFRDYQRIQKILVKERGGGFAQPKLKDIYKEYVE